MLRRDRGGVQSDETIVDKGRKILLRLRILSCRKLVALAAVGLCIVAGGRRLYGFPAKKRKVEKKESPRLRGNPVATNHSEVLPMTETRYCSAPLEYPVVHSPEGEGGDALYLRQLQVTIRHGDRSAIHDLPGAWDQKWPCLPFSRDTQETWEEVSRFHVENVDGSPLDRSLLPDVYSAKELAGSYKGQEDMLCKQGQLTEAGIQQHLALGQSMREAYAGLLGDDLGEEEVYVRSTNYRRTLESAAAFLISFLPGTEEMTIITNEDEGREIMHGIGLKESSKASAGGLEKTIVGACERAAELDKLQMGQFKARSDVVSDLAFLFGNDISALKMTSTADALHARTCHGMPLPCSDKGCMQAELALSVMAEADRQMCMRYIGAAGGAKAAALSLYPFMQEILTKMKKTLSGESSIKFALFSGHDTVVAPLLAALGAYNCRWPPYASHVAFELWSKSSARKSRRSLRDEGDGSSENREQGDSNPSAKVKEEFEVEDGIYVRVTFNGQPVTHHIKDCREYVGPYGQDFCPLSAFEHTIERAVAPSGILEKACRAS